MLARARMAWAPFSRSRHGVSAMTIECPHCDGKIEAEPTPGQDLVCPSCGSTIPGASGSTGPWRPTAVGPAPRRLGKFEFLEPLGAGAFGAVYKARDTELGRTVAIKIPRAV